MVQKILTERMELSPVSEQEIEEIHQLWTQPLVRKYLWDDEIIPLSQTQEIVLKSIIAFSNNQYGIWVSRLINQSNIIGFSGYWPFFEPPQIQFIYGLSPNYWGKGLATEMAKSLIEYGFKKYMFKTIYASSDLPNKASISVMKRLGMSLDKTTIINDKEIIFYQKTLFNNY